jgi:hypothetical protein
VPVPVPVAALNDFDNAQASRLDIRNGRCRPRCLDDHPKQRRLPPILLEFLGTTAGGFSRPILFNNEEGIDWVNVSGTQWPATEGAGGRARSAPWSLPM